MKVVIKIEEKKVCEVVIEDVKEEILESYKVKELENEVEIFSEVVYIFEMIEKDEMCCLIF